VPRPTSALRPRLRAVLVMQILAAFDNHTDAVEAVGFAKGCAHASLST
jgi:hypothetical protein